MDANVVHNPMLHSEGQHYEFVCVLKNLGLLKASHNFIYDKLHEK